MTFYFYPHAPDIIFHFSSYFPYIVICNTLSHFSTTVSAIYSTMCEGASLNPDPEDETELGAAEPGDFIFNAPDLPAEDLAEDLTGLKVEDGENE